VLLNTVLKENSYSIDTTEKSIMSVVISHIELSCVFEETFGMYMERLLQAVTLFVGDISSSKYMVCCERIRTCQGDIHQDDVKYIIHFIVPWKLYPTGY
jgi:hypothetical protein